MSRNMYIVDHFFPELPVYVWELYFRCGLAVGNLQSSHLCGQSPDRHCDRDRVGLSVPCTHSAYCCTDYRGNPVCELQGTKGVLHPRGRLATPPLGPASQYITHTHIHTHCMAVGRDKRDSALELATNQSCELLLGGLHPYTGRIYHFQSACY